MSTVQTSAWRLDSQFKLPAPLIGSRLRREGIQQTLAGLPIEEAREDYFGQLEFRTPNCIVGYHNTGIFGHKWHYAPLSGQEIADVPVQTEDRRVTRILDRHPHAKWLLRSDVPYELHYIQTDVPCVALVQDGHRFYLEDTPLARWESDEFVLPAAAAQDFKHRLIETLTPWRH